MKHNIIVNVLRPIIDRIGTATASSLVAIGLTQTEAQNVVLAITMIAGVGVDLIIRRVGGAK